MLSSYVLDCIMYFNMFSYIAADDVLYSSYYVAAPSFSPCLLQDHFELNPKYEQMMRADKPYHSIKMPEHLRNVPDYLGN